MNGFLKQSTASQSRLIGPFVNDVDFITAETGLTIANTDIKLRANGTTLSNKNSGGGTHQVNGMYSVTWDATDTANVGELFYSVKVTDAMQVFGSYVVLEEAVYDALFAASAAGYGTASDVTAIKAITDAVGATAAARLALTLGNSPTATIDNTAFTATTSELETSTITEATADHYNGRVILFTSGAVAHRATSITDYSLVSGRGHFTYTALNEAPANGVTFIII